MNHSINATNLICSFEGLRLTSYQDQNKVWTIGFGHTGNVVPGMTITKLQAELYLTADLVSTDVAINNLVKVPLNQNQYDALTSLVFNIGSGHFSTSTTLRDLNNKDYSGAAEGILLWNKAAGEVNTGLVRRRNAERGAILEGVMR